MANRAFQKEVADSGAGVPLVIGLEQLATRFTLHLPDQMSRRVRQATAAASLSKINCGERP
ncbi:MAG: hypothetical protein JXM69_12580 [Anaerolineae bacterium]|nr:hypothetical protein [Anaerolineae bacterium]